MANWRNRRLTAEDEALVAEVEKQLTAPADSSSQPIDTEAVRRRYDQYKAAWADRAADHAMAAACAADAADDVPALLAALEEARRERDELRQHILDIDAHATPYGDLPDEPGYVGTYLLTAGALHRALGKIGHTGPKCAAEAAIQRVRKLAQDADRDYRMVHPGNLLAALDGTDNTGGTDD